MEWLFVCSSASAGGVLQSIFLQQYFQQCFVLGMKVRTAIMGAVYKKVFVSIFYCEVVIADSHFKQMPKYSNKKKKSTFVFVLLFPFRHYPCPMTLEKSLLLERLST